MKYFSLAALVLLLPATLARSVHPAAAHTHSHDGDDYGKGGRYGFKSCTDRGLRPGRVSCLNFDSIDVANKTGITSGPKSPLYFSPQWSLANTTTLQARDELPEHNAHAAVSPPNAMIASRYNPHDKHDTSPAYFTSSADDGTFDLFGFYVQPMAISPESGIKGIDVMVTGVPSQVNGGDYFNHTWAASFPVIFLDGKSIYFDALEATGQLWDGLMRVEVSAQLAEVESDWEVWVDDIWLRWGDDKEGSAAKAGGDGRQAPLDAEL